MASVVTGISPKEGKPGTKLTIRGENFGSSPSDLVAVFVCGTNCVYSAEWHSKLGLKSRCLIIKLKNSKPKKNRFKIFIYFILNNCKKPD